MDLELIATSKAKSADRTLDLLIVKQQTFGVFSHTRKSFSKLYDPLLAIVFKYDAAI